MKRKKEYPKIEEYSQVSTMEALEGVKAGDNVHIPIYRVCGKASTIHRDLRGKIVGFSLIANEGIYNFVSGNHDYVMKKVTQEIIDGKRSYY